MNLLSSIFRKVDVAKTEEELATNNSAVVPYGPKTYDAPPIYVAPAANNSAVALYAPKTYDAPPVAPKRSRPVADLPRAKLVFGLDNTASRENSWATKIALTDALFTALPGKLDVALAVHGGGRLHTFTKFESDAGRLRDRAAALRCKPGFTKFLDLVSRVLATEGVNQILYIGDAFEESPRRARKLADALKARNIRLIILHDTTAADHSGADVFAEMAKRTGGAVLPFNAASVPKLQAMFSAIAVLAVGGTPMLVEKQETMAAARLLLEHLKGNG
jgi:hypothetical protein